MTFDRTKFKIVKLMPSTKPLLLNPLKKILKKEKKMKKKQTQEEEEEEKANIFVFI